MNKLFVLCTLFFVSLSYGQTITIKGKITDDKTGEPLTGVSVYFVGVMGGVTTDFEGYFEISNNGYKDSLMATYVGYKEKLIRLNKDTLQEVNIRMKLTAAVFEAKVTTKVNRALRVIKEAQKAKERYNIENLNSYESENFTKIQIAINNVSENTKNKKLMKSVQGIFDTIRSLSGDSGKQVLPIFLSENLSNFYFNKNPNLSKEVIIASRVKGVGVDDGSFLSQLMGSTFQQYNFNDNILPILQKNFISPISKSSLLYYNFKFRGGNFPDSLATKKLYMIEVTPKNPLDLVFTGYIWIEDSTFALKRVSLSITNKANLNFVEKLKITQEYEPSGAGAYIPVKNRVLIDIAEISKNSPGMVAVFSSSSTKIKTNVDRNAKFFDYKISMNEDATMKNDAFWDTARHEKLSIDEKRALAKIDTITNIKVIKNYVEIINIIFNGYKKIGKIDFGPYALLYGNNVLEGHRIRIGARTNFSFSKRFTFSGYGAYGFLDEQWKYKGQAEAILSRKHWTTIGTSYKKDVEQIGVTDDYYGASNLFTAVSVFAANQLNRAKESKFWATSEFIRGWNAKIIFSHKEFQFEQIKNFNFAYNERLNTDTTFRSSNFTNAAITLGLRWAPKEYYLQNDNERIRQTKPGALALSINYTKGIKGVLGSRFDYNRVTATIEKGLSFGYWGRTDFTLSGTKIFEVLPYPLLEVHRGNQSFFYSTSSYNLMNFFEFITDKSAFFKMEHHFNGALLNRIPLMKKLKWREFVEGRAVLGNLSNQNKDLIPKNDERSAPVSPINNLINKEPYIEVAYGLENIFKILQVAAVHRLTHLGNPGARKFGVKFGFSVSF